MIADSNSLTGFLYNSLVGSTGGDFLLLGLLVLLIVGMAFIVGRVKAGTALMVGVFLVFVFALFVPSLMVLFWIILVVSLVVLVNGLRKMFIGY